MSLVSNSRIKEIVGQFSSQLPPLVVGDLGVDKYTFGIVSRISPEAPVPVLEVQKEWPVLGLAGNVAHNLKTLGAKGLLCGVTGDDRQADILEEMLKKLGLSTTAILRDGKRSTTFKERVTTATQQICRIDYETSAPIDLELEDRILAKVNTQMHKHGCLIIQDYGKGGITRRLSRELIRLYRLSGKKVFVDPSRWTPALDYKGADYIKPNWEEAKILCQSLGLSENLKPEIMAPFLLDKLDLQGVIITLGGDGMALYTKDSLKFTRIPTLAQEVFDVSGAGDTVISAFALALQSGATFEEAAWVSNCAAGVVVAKKGTATVKVEEIINYHLKSLGAL